MKFHPLLLSVLALAVVGCDTPYKKKDEEDKKPFKDQAGDHSFQAFIGRLREAVARRDKAMLSTLLTPDFGYRWDATPPGETAFSYWDKHNLWPELEAILRENFAPKDLYMVAPPAAVDDPNYNGWRAGMRLMRGSWKFAYFVPTEGAQ
jgi:hypothetical protein